MEMRSTTHVTTSPPHADVLAMLANESLAGQARWFVHRFQHDLFDGWPRGVHYIHDLHAARLERVRLFLPGRLRGVTRCHLWTYLTVAVNQLRDQRTAAYVDMVGATDMWDEI